MQAVCRYVKAKSASVLFKTISPAESCQVWHRCQEIKWGFYKHHAWHIYYMTGGCCRWVCQRAFLSKSPPAPPQKNSGSLHCQLCNLNQKKVCNVAWCHSVDAQSREMNVWDTLNARGWWWNVSVGKDSHHSAHFAIILQRSNCSGKYNVAKIPLWPFVGQMLFHR